jgi:hypothetical protein
VTVDFVKNMGASVRQRLLNYAKRRSFDCLRSNELANQPHEEDPGYIVGTFRNMSEDARCWIASLTVIPPRQLCCVS